MATTAQDRLEEASAQLLIELVFLIPIKDQETFDRVGKLLMNYKDALVESLKEGA